MRWVIFLVALVVGTALDLWTKSYAFSHLPRVGSTYPVWDWFAFTHARNEGAAFGMFQGQHTFFMVISVLALVAVPYFVHTAPRRSRAMPLLLGLILAGVCGNFWDRVVFGYVRDFLDVHTPPAGALHDFFDGTLGRTIWPTFNLADVFITTGVICLVVFFGREPRPDEAGAVGPAAPDAAAAPAPMARGGE